MPPAPKPASRPARPAPAPVPVEEADTFEVVDDAPTFEVVEESVGTPTFEIVDEPAEESPRPVRTRGTDRGQKPTSKKLWIFVGSGSAAALAIVGVVIYFLFFANKPKPVVAQAPSPAPAQPVAQPAAQPPVPAAPAAAWNLTYLPPKTQILFGLRPAAIINAPVLRQFRALIAIGLQSVEQELGIPIHSIDQVVGTGEMKSLLETRSLMVVHTLTPIDAAQVRGKLQGVSEATHQGKSYLKKKMATPGFGAGGGSLGGAPGQPAGAAPGSPENEVAVWFADPTTMVVGTESMVQAAMAQGPSPPAIDAAITSSLTELGNSTQVMIVLKLDALKPIFELVSGGLGMGMGLPGLGGQAAAAPQMPPGFDKVQVVGMALTATQNLELAAVADCGGDATAAAAVQAQVQEGIAEAQKALAATVGMMQSQLPPDAPGNPVAQAARAKVQADVDAMTAVQHMIQGAQVAVAGTKVRLKAELAGAAIQVVMSMAANRMAAAGFGPTGQPGGVGAPPGGQIPGIQVPAGQSGGGPDGQAPTIPGLQTPMPGAGAPRGPGGAAPQRSGGPPGFPGAGGTPPGLGQPPAKPGAGGPGSGAAPGAGAAPQANRTATSPIRHWAA
jgi:hypothetical protein